MNTSVKSEKKSQKISFPRDIRFMLKQYDDFYSTFFAIAPERFSLSKFNEAKVKQFGYMWQDLELKKRLVSYNVNEENSFNLSTTSDYDVDSIFLFEKPRFVNIKGMFDGSIKLIHNSSSGLYVEHINHYIRASHNVDSISLYLSNSEECREFAQKILKEDPPKDKTLAFLVGGDKKF